MTDEHGADIPEQPYTYGGANDGPTKVGVSLKDIGAVRVYPEGSTHNNRRFLPTLADLVDRLSIVQLKAVFITAHRDEYMQERADIEHDINLIINEKGIKFDASALHAVMMIMLSNRFIWENESKARAGGADQDRLLKLTHSINGVRNTAKNQLAVVDGGRKDYKVDCFAAELHESYGNWNVFV